MLSNPLHQIIYDSIVKPSLDKLSFEAEGIVTEVNYLAQTVNVRWRDHSGGLFRATNVPLPRDGDGVFKQAVKVGARVKLGFEASDHGRPFVSMVYTKNSSKSDYFAPHGAGIMKGVNYILGE